VRNLQHLKEPDLKPDRLEAWRAFQAALAEARTKLAALSARTPGGVSERCWAGLYEADLWSR